MKRSIIIMAAIMLLALPLAGCVTDDSKTAVNPITTQVTQVQNDLKNTQADVKALQDSVSKKVDLSTVTDLIKTAGAAGASSGYSKAETYTRAEVDGLLLALKNDQSWIKGSNSNTPNTNVPLINNGDYSYRVYQKPSSPVYADGQTYSWALEITNNTGKWKKLQLAGTLNPDASVAGTGVCTSWNNSFTSPAGTFFNCLNYSLSGTNPTGVMPTYVTAGTPTPSIMFGSPGSNGTIFTFGAGEKKLLWVSLNLNYTSGVTQWADPTWNISLSD